MSIFIVTLVLIATLLVILAPFVIRRSRRDDLDEAAVELGQRLRRARDRVYEEVRALQQEYFLGTMTEEEYQERLRDARLAAASLMRQQQQVQQTLADIDEEVELEMGRAASLSASETSEPDDDSPERP